MTGKEILGIKMEDPRSHLKESIGDYIKDVIDEVLCEELFSEICDKRNLVTEEDIDKYSFYNDPIWKEAWNKKVDEMVTVLKL